MCELTLRIIWTVLVDKCTFRGLERIRMSIVSRSPNFNVLENSMSHGCKTYVIQKVYNYLIKYLYNYLINGILPSFQLFFFLMLLIFESLIMNKLVVLHVPDDDYNLKEILFYIKVLDHGNLILQFQAVILLFQDERNGQIQLKLRKN